MKAIKITICGANFLLPDSHQFYEFPAFILKHKDIIGQYVKRAEEWKEEPLKIDFSGLPDVSELKRITGIIGFPFDSHDPDLYAIDRKIDIVLEAAL